MRQPLILAIDTSCDETCAAVTQGRKVLSNVVASQINIHQKYGGVVPHLAKRAHQAKIEFVVKEATTRSLLADRQGDSSLDAIAVTVGPGLAPALEVGIDYAKKLALKWHKPLIAINHMEGHLLSSLAQPNTPGCRNIPPRGGIGLLVSGGHTQLILVKKIGQYQLLGETLDDAAGEALDKLAKMLKLGYPGGPIIEALAKNGNPDSIKLPIPMQYSKNLNFSFSGLKTAALYLISPRGERSFHPGVEFIYDMCAGFQKAIALSLTTKLKKAIDQYQPKALLLGGGVFANLYLRRQVRSAAKPLPVFIPYSKKLFTDNAAMIAIAAYYKFLKKDFVKDIDKLDRQPNLNF
ncbi:tRNA (adenosine(37)-N6)-threonylcarbamoyltransferase complex transferase subunit TsaD [Candidatus Beckwithbacteria bacterium RIFCSPLOWO2_02_FULL_47_23]|uniref:tRNA N6-adenosine threonylcarbamoyltransferase n=1 Tax=Candidatus Beckwithbacteria bacterium RIFCSPLOWO2_02_FULL_47_23 TaxID=1797463 RepID=A0A1F5DVH8_9BACT|nr:MAG: tRNA (adenosine(37)-N6)-threonylcarbamoyltransferase complex transferase subunit TsaD [Candidatus Beckwithbacteria bacterium RIFCSPLOWO2_02_FULL_47_23]